MGFHGAVSGNGIAVPSPSSPIDGSVYAVRVGFGVNQIAGFFGEGFAGGILNPQIQNPINSWEGDVLGFGCMPPGQYRWQMSYECDIFLENCQGPTGPETGCTIPIGGSGPSGTFTVSPGDSAIHLSGTALMPPTPQGNVNIAYAFGPNDLAPEIDIDFSYPKLQPTNYRGNWVLTLDPGVHFITAKSCFQLAYLTTIEVPAPTPPPSPPAFTFDLNDGQQVKVLTHKYRNDDAYPSPDQTADHRIKVTGSVKKSDGTPVPGKTVTFRLIDPPDPSPYVVANGDSHPGDNIDGPGTLN